MTCQSLSYPVLVPQFCPLRLKHLLLLYIAIQFNLSAEPLFSSIQPGSGAQGWRRSFRLLGRLGLCWQSQLLGPRLDPRCLTTASSTLKASPRLLYYLFLQQPQQPQLLQQPTFSSSSRLCAAAPSPTADIHWCRRAKPSIVYWLQFFSRKPLAPATFQY